MERISKYNLVLFDLDGTLLNTIPDLGNAVNHALGIRDLPLHGMDEYPAMVGHGIRNLVINALPESLRGKDDFVDEVLADFSSYYTAHIDDETRPYPGIPETISDLQDSGCALAVVSNKFQAGTVKLIKRFFPSINWLAVMGNMEGMPLKPDPAIVQMIFKSYASLNGDIIPKAVMVGDSSSDIRTGKNAGISTIAVTWGYRSASSLGEADIMAHNVEELRAALLNG